MQSVRLDGRLREKHLSKLVPQVVRSSRGRNEAEHRGHPRDHNRIAPSAIAHSTLHAKFPGQKSLELERVENRKVESPCFWGAATCPCGRGGVV